MGPFMYLFKVNLAIALLYGLYRLFCQRDTFFRWKRMLLLSILLFSFLYPLWKISAQWIRNEMLLSRTISGIVSPVSYLDEMAVTANVSSADGSLSVWSQIPQILAGVYFMVTLGLIVWMLVQIIHTIVLLVKTTSVEISGRKIRQRVGLETPFSFFNYIVMDISQYDTDELDEILLHENVHVRQRHSIDMMMAELMCAVCWFNPLVWLMKKEIRMNLEYLADRSVVASGCDVQHYQFHLLRLSYYKAAAKFTNNFSVSPLKKRIKMMNKKETSLFGTTKYVLFIPLVAGLLLFNCTNATNSKKENQEEQTAESAVSNETENSDAQSAVKEGSDELLDGEKVYITAEVMPEYPGGISAMMSFIAKNILYPIDAQERGIQGKIIISFVIKADGSLGKVEVLKSVDTSLDKEAVRVVRSMPKWTPGKENGKAVAVKYTVPINFRLQS